MSLTGLPQWDTIEKEIKAVRRRIFLLHGRDLINVASFDTGRDIVRLLGAWFHYAANPDQSVMRAYLHEWCLRHLDSDQLRAGAQTLAAKCLPEAVEEFLERRATLPAQENFEP